MPSPSSDIRVRAVDLWSEGTRLAGDLYLPPAFDAAESRPAIVLCHGWGGMKEHLPRHGRAFAQAGYVTLAFDYRGWGESDGKLIPREPVPAQRIQTHLQVQVVREVVDPFDELWDVRHAIDFISGEPGVNPARIGLWGSSFGGGLVVWMAAHDDRVGCVVSQVGAQDGRALGDADQDESRRIATAQARGDQPPIPQGENDTPGLNGAPHRSKMAYWAPVDSAEMIRVPVLLIDAEHEELMDRHRHSELVYKRMKAAAQAPVGYHVVERISHYAIYDERFDEATGKAIAWFNQHL